MRAGLAAALQKPIAHRGLHDRALGVIENSRAAFERAIEKGYGIECDLQLSGDDVPMVFHDATLDRVTEQKGRLRQISAGQIGRIPLAGSATGDCPLRFAELLELIDGRVPLCVELKPHSDAGNGLLAEKAAAAVRGYSGPIAFISFVPELLVAMRRSGFSGPLGAIADRFDGPDARRHLSPLRRFWLRHLLHYPQTRFDFITANQNALKMPAIRLFRALGFPVATWTITSEEQARAVAPYVDAIAFEGFEPSGA